jgi:ribosomal protein S3AE
MKVDAERIVGLLNANSHAAEAITGDMLLAALVDLTGDIDALTSLVKVLNRVNHHARCSLKIKDIDAGGISAKQVSLTVRRAKHQEPRDVQQTMVAIAQEMGLPEDQVDALRMAGIVHDLGKISIPAEILSKPSELSDIELSLIKTHPQISYDILKAEFTKLKTSKMALPELEALRESLLASSGSAQAGGQVAVDAGREVVPFGG